MNEVEYSAYYYTLLFCSAILLVSTCEINLNRSRVVTEQFAVFAKELMAKFSNTSNLLSFEESPPVEVCKD